MKRVLAIVLVAATILVGVPVLAQPVSGASDAFDACAMAGDGRFKSADKSRCEGFWNVYASIPGGDVWWFDNRAGEDPKAGAIQAVIDRKAALIQRRLKRCRVTSYVSLSNWFDAFGGDFVVVHSNPHASRATAEAELRRGRSCGVAGYTKFSTYQFAGQD